MLGIAVELAALRGGAKNPQAYRYNNAAGITSSTSCTSAFLDEVRSLRLAGLHASRLSGQ
jgi:hypothetical protein